MSRAYYITTPIYYVNDVPHIGHTYTTVVADTLARYHRLCGDDTFFATGNDEHGEKVAQAAEARGVTPQAFVDEVAAEFRSTWETLGFSFDRFIRTTDADHRKNVQNILQQVYDAGEIEFREYDGLYCVGCERFLTDRDLEDGLCKDHERAPEKRSESNYFFKMSAHFDWLVETLNNQPDFIRPERYRNEVLGMLRDQSGLEDLCISRPKERLEWGIELPFDSNYVCYVWFDALINYLTAAGYPDGDGFERHWANVDHLIGKDILKPHGVFWPIMLKVMGAPIYQHLNVHGYWTVEGRKMSKSLGNVVSPLTMRDRYGFESFRYFLLREMVFGLDGNFSESALVARNNGDLANKLGNLVNRALNMTARFCDGQVPSPGTPGASEKSVADAAELARREIDGHLSALEFHRALESLFAFVDRVNQYVDERAPWKLAKDPAARADLETTLYTACEAMRVIGVLLAPFLPEAAAEIRRRLGSTTEARMEDAAWGQLQPGTATTKGDPLFPRFEEPDGAAS